jgi:serine/threonine-protein kinase
MALKPGTRLGSFEVLGPLGAGGMGEVYRARDSRLGRDVAIKVLPEAFARDPARAARFEREARLLAAINHPAIAAIYGAEEFDSLRCIIMELVPGETLAERMARGPIPLAEACDLSRQIVEALEAAHERGVIHRDLKPSNIKVTPEGKVKVLDLGLAKAMEMPSPDEGLSDSPTVTLEQTRPGVILGTIEFMSPEQARGKPVDKRTDIWAFGCIFYEMLSGRRAFTGETSTDVFAAILTKAPDWSALPAATPPRLRELISRCLQKDSSKRLRDIGDARNEIDRAARDGEAEPMATASVSGARTRPWVAAGIAALLLGAAAFWLIQRNRGSPTAGMKPGESLVVLPVRVLSDAPGGQLVGDGLVEMLSFRLNQVPGIQVVTPATAVAASDKNSDRFGAARSVGANLLVNSSLIQSGGRLRMIYSVWNVRTRAQVVGGKVDGSASDLLGMQDQLADDVAAGLRLPPPARKRLTPTGLETAEDQRLYVEAVGLLQRYDRRDSVEKALGILEPLVGERPNSALAQAALGRACLAMFDITKERGWADRAFSASETARRLDPALSEVDVTLGETFLLTGRAKDAIEAFRRALKARPASYEALLGLGHALEESADDGGAEAAFRRAIALQPGSFAAYNHLGVLYADRGRFREAAEMFRTVTELAPDSYRAFSNLGAASTMVCDFNAALETYRKALVLRPDNPLALLNLGMTQLWTGRSDEAVLSLEKASGSTPNDYRIWANLGDAYRAAKAPKGKADNAFARSIALARDQLRLNPGDALAYSSLATSLAKTGQAAEASAPMRKALALDDKNPKILSKAAIVAALAGRTDEAMSWLKKAVAAGYCPAIIARQPEFAALRSDPRFLDLTRGVARGAA